MQMTWSVSSINSESLTQNSLRCNSLNEAFDRPFLLRRVIHKADDELTSKMKLMIDYNWLYDSTSVQSEVECFHNEYEYVSTSVPFVQSDCFCDLISTHCFILRLFHNKIKSIEEYVKLQWIKVSFFKRRML